MAATAGSRMAGSEPAAEDVAAARRMLRGEITADEAIHGRLAQIVATYGIER